MKATAIESVWKMLSHSDKRSICRYYSIPTGKLQFSFRGFTAGNGFRLLFQWVAQKTNKNSVILV